jgi:hypothetical protein
VVPPEAGWSWSGPLRMITKQQYRKLMSEYQETGNVSDSAMKADMSRPTAHKYIEAGHCSLHGFSSQYLL